jgi:hypothetical protein
MAQQKVIGSRVLDDAEPTCHTPPVKFERAGQSRFDRGIPSFAYQGLRAFLHPAIRQSNHGHQDINGHFAALLPPQTSL